MHTNEKRTNENRMNQGLGVFAQYVLLKLFWSPHPIRRISLPTEVFEEGEQQPRPRCSTLASCHLLLLSCVPPCSAFQPSQFLSLSCRQSHPLCTHLHYTDTNHHPCTPCAPCPLYFFPLYYYSTTTLFFIPLPPLCFSCFFTELVDPHPALKESLLQFDEFFNQVACKDA